MKALSIRSLWLAFAVVTAMLVGLLLYRLAGVFSVDEATMPRFIPMSTDRVAPSFGVALPGKNPFDPTGAPWTAVQEGGSQAGAGHLKGVVLLPGAQFVLTESGLVKPGAELAEGKLLAVSSGGVLVEAAGRQEQIPVAASKRVRLNDLNKLQPRTVVKEQGRP